MPHLDEAALLELVEHGETHAGAAARRHLATCHRCARRYHELRRMAHDAERALLLVDTPSPATHRYHRHRPTPWWRRPAAFAGVGTAAVVAVAYVSLRQEQEVTADLALRDANQVGDAAPAPAGPAAAASSRMFMLAGMSPERVELVARSEELGGASGVVRISYRLPDGTGVWLDQAPGAGERDTVVGGAAGRAVLRWTSGGTRIALAAALPVDSLRALARRVTRP